MWAVARTGSAYSGASVIGLTSGSTGFFNEAGDRIILGTQGAPTGIRLYSFNGAAISFLASNSSRSDDINISKQIPTRIFNGYDNTVWSFAGDTLTSVGALSPAFLTPNGGFGFNSGLAPD
jgi:hypothetical protein